MSGRNTFQNDYEITSKIKFWNQNLQFWYHHLNRESRGVFLTFKHVHFSEFPECGPALLAHTLKLFSGSNWTIMLLARLEPMPWEVPTLSPIKSMHVCAHIYTQASPRYAFRWLQHFRSSIYFWSYSTISELWRNCLPKLNQFFWILAETS